jgi:hypothetical protein
MKTPPQLLIVDDQPMNVDILREYHEAIGARGSAWL